MQPIIIKKIHFFLIFLSIILISGCVGEAKDIENDNEVKDVNIQTLKFEQANQYYDYPASIKGQQNVEIRPKIDGFIEQILIDEGAKVKKGQLLFKISNPMYEQEVLSAKASIERFQAAVNTARMNYKKTVPLVEKGIISEYELEAKDLDLQSKQAELEEAKARLRNAKVNLSYTSIFSPSNGIIGTLPFKIGSLVSSSSPEPLTVVSDISNVHVYFSISEKQYLAMIEEGKNISLEQSIAKLPQVELILQNGMVYPQKGKIETSGGLINSTTGSISLRAEFPNENGLIRSGSSATIRMEKPISDAILIPAKATFEMQGNKFAIMLDQDNKAKTVGIEVSDLPIGDSFVVVKGLKPGDLIVTENVGSIKDGDLLKPKQNEKIAEIK